MSNMDKDLRIKSSTRSTPYPELPGTRSDAVQERSTEMQYAISHGTQYGRDGILRIAYSEYEIVFGIII